MGRRTMAQIAKDDARLAADVAELLAETRSLTAVKVRTVSQELVRCERSGTPHPMTERCVAPHFAGAYLDTDVVELGRIPSMTAAETLDPREAVLS